MKLTVQDLKEIMEILNSAEDFRPIIHAAMQVLDSYSTEIAKYPKALALFGADLTKEVFCRYLDHGFSREEALLLTINQRLSVKEAFERSRNV